MDTYEKKYKESLAKARRYYLIGKGEPVDFIKMIFPELAESEDEKTRKEIIYHIKNCDDTIDEETEKRMIAWLENIPYTIDHEKREGFHLGYKAGLEKQGREKPQRMISAEAKEAMYDKPAWSEEDENMLEYALDMIEWYSGKNEDKSRLVSDWLKSLKQKYTWKPSDEQMHALHDLNLTGNISYAGQGQTLIELYNDLKKLTEE